MSNDKSFSLINGNAVSMTSLEIAALVESRHDKVKQSIERLADRGAIQLPPLGKVENKQSLSPNNKVEIYTFTGDQGKRDSIIVVAQLSPEFTARLVDRWQELESKVASVTSDAVNTTSRLQTIINLVTQIDQECAEKTAAIDQVAVQMQSLLPIVNGIAITLNMIQTPSNHAPPAMSEYDDAQSLGDQEIVLCAMRLATQDGKHVTTAKRGTITTWHVLKPYFQHDEFISFDARKRFNNAVAKLEYQGKMRRVIELTPNRKHRERWNLTLLNAQ